MKARPDQHVDLEDEWRDLQILDTDQHAAMSFIAAANSGGNLPQADAVLQWIAQPKPRSSQPGPLIRRGRPAKYRRVGGLADSLFNAAEFQSGLRAVLDNSTILQQHLKQVADAFNSNMAPTLAALTGKQILVEEAIPDEYGPDVPAETIIDCLIRLTWVEQDSHGSLSLSPLGRALLRSHRTEDDNSVDDGIIVLNSNDELAYPVLMRTLAEAGDALVIDPYLRLAQLREMKTYTSVSRVLISENLAQEDRVAMAVHVKTSFNRDFEIRVASRGVLHDRMIIGRSKVFTIGTSMNTVGRQHPTILTTLPDPAGDVLRDHAERWWEDAEHLASYPSTEEE